MSQVVLTHGYFINEDAKEQKIMRPYAPLGILSISAFLTEHAIDNEVFDTTFSSKTELSQYLRKQRPQYLGIYINLMTKPYVIQLIQQIKTDPALQHITVILGGPDTRYNAKNLLEAQGDFIVIGEGEQTMLELIQALEAGNRVPEQVQGLAFMKEGQYHQTPERTKVKSIDILPSPDRSKIDLDQYLKVWKSHHGQSSITLSTMRGCPYTCKWCSRAVYGLSYRRRSPEKVVDEIVHLQANYEFDLIWFVDDVFTVSHKWLKKFSETLRARNVKVSYECITRADRMNAEVVQLLKESGCFRVWVGAESGSQKIIDLMDRRVEVSKVQEMIQLAGKNGIETGTFIMLGYPQETEEDIEATIQHLKKANPDHFTITLAYPIKGTELYDETSNIQVHPPEWNTTTDRDIDFQRTYSRKYYKYALSRVINEVNFYKRYTQKPFSIETVKLKAKVVIAKAGMWWEKQKMTPVLPPKPAFFSNKTVVNETSGK